MPTPFVLVEEANGMLLSTKALFNEHAKDDQSVHVTCSERKRSSYGRTYMYISGYLCKSNTWRSSEFNMDPCEHKRFIPLNWQPPQLWVIKICVSRLLW